VTHALMQPDGNFVCYDATGHAFWATGTNGHPGSDIILQDDGNLVVYGPSGGPLGVKHRARLEPDGRRHGGRIRRTRQPHAKLGVGREHRTHLWTYPHLV
jgi:hypothetical protein